MRANHHKEPKISSSHRPARSMELYVTDHPDDPRESREHLSTLYGKLKEFGFSSVRYDWRWAAIEPQEARTNKLFVEHYRQVKEVMDAVGLNAPTVVLSSPPAWALDLYRGGKTTAFYVAFKRYAELVASNLNRIGGKPVRTVQVLNELNNHLYTRIRPEGIAGLCTITREAFYPYCGEVQLLSTVLALPNRPLVSSVLPFLRQHRETLESSFDVIGIDYYPGVWHWPSLGEAAAALKVRHGVRETAVGNTGLLESVYKEIATWQLRYELAEVGWTSYALFGGQAAQAACYAIFLRAYRRMLAKLSDQGYAMPERMGIYAARDEAAAGRLRYITRWQRWGLCDNMLEAKCATDILWI